MKPDISPPVALDTAFANISALAEDFGTHEAKYLSPAYQEADVRKDFLDKFFTALGWDVNHKREKNPYEQEVKVELGQQQGAARKRADYAFHLAPNFKQPRFFVEAKKPSRTLANAEDYFQTIRYGFSAQTPLAVLTDFEEFHILDSRYKAAPETALNRIVHGGVFHFRDYLDREKFARIYWLFAREAVIGGSLEKFAAGLPKPRGGAKQLALFPGGDKPFDEVFLEELDGHRLALAKAFKKSDDSLDSGTLTEITQRTLDRLVFIRFLEDRLIEANDIISHLGATDSAWAGFRAQCHRLDGIYNGIVFKKHPLLDSPGFSPDEDSFADICEALSHKNSAYDFSSVPIHILGSIYERFLGNVILATPRQARIGQKPEARKAGGVYYTPDYIVRHIVDQTVGKLIESRNPEAVAQMRFADIACGGGSFLLGIYECLLAYHTAYYNKFPKRATQADCLTRDGSLHLTLKKRRDILLNNIYGVDIDAQAVEVAQLSLYLRLLQDETSSSAHQYRMDFEQQALLPSLADNIKCGNSLIGTDILHGKFQFSQEEEKKLNPMDFDAAFPSIFPRPASVGKVAETPDFDEWIEGGLIHAAPGPRGKSVKYSEKSLKRPRVHSGGFDAVIGNPPYGAEFTPAAKSYLTENYPNQSYQLDSYLVFLERTLASLLKPSGFLGMIIPNPWLTNLRQDRSRQYIISTALVREVVHFCFPVFPKVTVDTEIVVLRKGFAGNWKVKTTIIESLAGFQGIDEAQKRIIFHNQDAWRGTDGRVINIFLSDSEKQLAAKCLNPAKFLSDCCAINVGIKPYQTGKGRPAQSRETVESRPFDSDKPAKGWRQYLMGKDIGRFIIAPLANRYLRYGPWLAEPRPAANFEAPAKIFMRQTGDKLIACLDTGQFLCLNNIHVIVPKSGADVKYLLGALNSRLLNWYYRTLNPEVGEALAEVKKTNVARLPIRAINPSNPADKQKHDQIILSVGFMLEAKKNLATAKTEKDTDYYEGKCAALDKKIDALIYDLYGLTSEEIALVESTT